MVCNNCNGSKKVMGLGGMKKDCVACSGNGFMNNKNEMVPVRIKRARRTKEEMALSRQKVREA